MRISLDLQFGCDEAALSGRTITSPGRIMPRESTFGLKAKSCLSCAGAHSPYVFRHTLKRLSPRRTCHVLIVRLLPGGAVVGTAATSTDGGGGVAAADAGG